MLRTKSLLSGLLVGSMAIATLVGCTKDDDDEGKNSYTVSATLNAANEVQTPAVVSPATGTLTGDYNSNTNVLTYNINWTNLTADVSGMHFHGPASATENAGVLLPITPATTSATGSTSGTATLTDAQETDMLAGKWYANIHTSNFPAGEIRGQISATP